MSSLLDRAAPEPVVATRRPSLLADGEKMEVLSPKTRKEPHHNFRKEEAFTTSEGLRLNCETWVREAGAPLLIYVPGIMESADTVTVNRLAIALLTKGWQLMVVELQGHGLSDGARGVIADFDRCVSQVNQVVDWALSRRPSSSGSTPPQAWALAGSSFGGTVAAYVADRSPFAHEKNFCGAILFSPAVGVDHRLLPNIAVRSGLRLLAYLAPEFAVLTPTEDPSPYAHPPDSTRNFRGQWPLATSRMLLDLTNGQVAEDLSSGKLTLDLPLLVFSGEKDNVVPIAEVRKFFVAAKSKDKSLVQVPNAQHDITVNSRFAHTVIEKTVGWLLRHAADASSPSSSSE